MTKLTIGKTYKDGLGKKHEIVGLTKISSEWVFSRSGSWFRQVDGRRIFYTPEKGHYFVENETFYDLQEVV